MIEIYFDDQCRICQNIAIFCQDHSSGSLVFIPICDSIYSLYEKDTIVVALGGVIHTYGDALRMILMRMDYPYRVFGYLPIRVLDIIYIIMRYARRYL